MSFNIREEFPFFLVSLFSFLRSLRALSPDTLYRNPNETSFNIREEALFFSGSLFSFLTSSRALSPDILRRNPKKRKIDIREELFCTWYTSYIYDGKSLPSLSASTGSESNFFFFLEKKEKQKNE